MGRQEEWPWDGNIKVANFQDGRLLPQPPDLRQKAWQFWTPADGLALHVQGLVRTFHIAFVFQSTIPSGLKPSRHRVGEKDSSEDLKVLSSEETDFFLFSSASLITLSFPKSLFLCVSV